mgnify:CR=1 FL=1
MNYATIKNCDIANGPGVRVSLFVSGCTHRCKGCFNEVAWDFHYGQPFTQETINMILEILDFIVENSVQLEEQMTQTLKSGLEYCASPNESIDGDLIIQQLEIMKQLLDLNFKKDTGVSEIKNLSAQSSVSSKTTTSTEIKTLHVNAQKLDLLVNQLGELIITKIKTEKNLEKIDSIKNANETCQKDLLKTSTNQVQAM